MSKRIIKPAPPTINHGMLGLGNEGDGSDIPQYIVNNSDVPITPTPQVAGKKRRASKPSEGTGMEGGTNPPKKTRTNTPWTPEEEQRLKRMRDAGNSWSEIAKTFPNRTEGSVKKHWYKDMHYAEFGQEESAALLAAIKEYDASKWKVIGQKVGKPAKACEAYAKEHFADKL